MCCPGCHISVDHNDCDHDYWSIAQWRANCEIYGKWRQSLDLSPNPNKCRLKLSALLAFLVIPKQILAPIVVKSYDFWRNQCLKTFRFDSQTQSLTHTYVCYSYSIFGTKNPNENLLYEMRFFLIQKYDT